MRYRVEISDQAERELIAAYDWIAADSPAHAILWLDGLYRAIQSLAAFPRRSGRAPEAEFFEEEIRHLVHGEYRVLYTIERNRVWVIHVRHGARPPLKPARRRRKKP